MKKYKKFVRMTDDHIYKCEDGINIYLDEECEYLSVEELSKFFLKDADTLQELMDFYIIYNETSANEKVFMTDDFEAFQETYLDDLHFIEKYYPELDVDTVLTGYGMIKTYRGLINKTRVDHKGELIRII